MTRPVIARSVVFALPLLSACSVPEPSTAGAVATSDVDRPAVIQEMIEAHGGASAWRDAEAVAFTTWPVEGGEPGPRFQIVVEQDRRRATVDVEGTPMRMAWDGEQAWGLSWELPYPPRFFALLHYYFFNLPWLTEDPGVRLELTGTKTLWEDPVEYITVMMTFEGGVGDTPDDYYELFIHPQTKRLHGCSYIVTYDALLPEGAAATPEKILVFDRTTEVAGLVVPSAFTIFEQDHSEYLRFESEGWDFAASFDESRVAMPDGAKVDDSDP